MVGLNPVFNITGLLAELFVILVDTMNEYRAFKAVKIICEMEWNKTLQLLLRYSCCVYKLL